MNDKIYKYEDLVKISGLLLENDLVYDNLTINIGIRTKILLNRINRDFYYKFNKDAKETELETVEEINIQINGVNFRYYLTNEDDTSNNE